MRAAYPESVAGKRSDAFDVLLRLGCERCRAKLIVLVLKDSGGRGDPEAAVRCFGDCGWRCGGGKRKRREALSVEAEDAAAGEDDESCRCLSVESETMCRRWDSGGMLPAANWTRPSEVPIQSELFESCAMQQVSLLVKAGGVFVVEDFEVDAVEAGDAVFGRDPDVAVA